MSEFTCSIIIATYGDDSWEQLAYERALPSARAQDPFEVLIGHDPDGTVSSVRNDLASKAQAEWLLFLDADDELASGYLDAMQRALKQERRDYGTPLLLMPAVSYVVKGRARPPLMRPVGDLTQDNFLVIGTLVPRELFLSVGGFNDLPHGFEDWSGWAKCWKAGAKIVQVKRAIYIAHVNPQSKHREGWKDRKWQVEMHLKVQRELFPEGV